MSEYSLREASRILKVSPKRLRYWGETALLETRGAGAFDFDELQQVRRVLRLIERGVSLRRIRRCVEAVRTSLPELERPLAALRVWADGSRRVVVRHDGGLFEPNGQMVLDFERRPPPVAQLRDEAPGFGRDAAMAWFEEGCRLDTDPATYVTAVEAYARAVEIDPDFADAHCNLGTVYYNQGRREQAEACFRDALRAAPQHVESHFNLANLLEDACHDQAALRHLKEALRADPLYADAHLNLALLYEKLALRRSAREHWRRYLQLEPGGSWADIARSRLSATDENPGRR